MRLCCQCRFWVPEGFHEVDEQSQEGFCHRRSPLVTGGLYGPEQTLWPKTSHADFCGDGLPRFEGRNGNADTSIA
jgi:hypothetical protein